MRAPELYPDRTRSSPSALREPLTRHPFGVIPRVGEDGGIKIQATSAAVLLLSLLASFRAGAATPVPIYWEGAFTFRDAELPIRLQIEGDPGRRKVSLDVPSMLMSWEPLTTVDQGGKVRVEFPFGLGTFELALDEAAISASGRLHEEPIVLRLSSGSPPPYSLETVRFASKDVELAGTLVVPKSSGPHPAVVLLHGSGDQSRGTWEYRSYADFFARNGLVVLMYDKRGTGDSKGAHWGDDRNFEGLTSDALAGITLLRARKDVLAGRIGLAGGSQAGWVMMLAATRSSDISFLVMDSVAAVSPMEQMIQSAEYQMRANSISEEQIASAIAYMRLYAYVAHSGLGWQLLEPLVAKARASNWKEYVLLPLSPPNLGWMGRHGDFDPVPLLKRIRVRVLAIWGENDVVVPPAENEQRLRFWLRRSGNDLVTTRVVPGADHRLELESGRDTRGKWHWFGVAPEVLQTLRDWLTANVGK